MKKIVEILQYTLHQGSGTAFHSIMKEISVPLHQCHGIDVVSFGNSLHDQDCYYLIRAFDSIDNMNTILDSFYASPDWRLGPRETIIDAIEKSIKTVISLPLVSLNGLRL
ncbi:NIPSNAP family protein [Providencia rettgeri]|nr:NIPSNAP family protein [Providencia rettgeri]